MYRSLDEKPRNPKNGDKYRPVTKGPVMIFMFGTWKVFKEVTKSVLD